MRRTTEPEDHRRPRRRSTVLLVLAALAVPSVLSGASFTASTKSTGRIGSAADWTPPFVSLVDPGDAIRGTATISATASDAETSVTQVVLSWAPSGTTAWTTICTDTVAPYSCPLSTTSLPDDDIDLRAVATDATGLSSTTVLEGVLVDNTAPTGSLGTIPNALAGVVVIPATASDATSGVASVAIQYAPSLGGAWTTICTDVDAPYSCRFDTTQVLLGSYDFRAIVTDVAGNTTTTSLVRNRTVNNTVDSVSVDDPGTYIRGTATITANASSLVGTTSVRIQRQLVGTSTWIDVCTDATAPYSCAWATTGVADGQYLLRAILVNGLGTSTTSLTVGPTQVDNTPVRGVDVQGTNGGTAGRVDTGDAVTLAYSRSMRPASILAGWDGSPRAVVVRLRDGVQAGGTGSSDALDVFTTSALSTPVNVGSVNLAANVIKNKKTVAYAATMVLQAATVNGQPATSVVLTLGALASGSTSSLRTSSAKPAMVWTPSAAALDTAGIATSTAPVTELGPLDADV